MSSDYDTCCCMPQVLARGIEPHQVYTFRDGGRHCVHCNRWDDEIVGPEISVNNED